MAINRTSFLGDRSGFTFVGILLCSPFLTSHTIHFFGLYCFSISLIPLMISLMFLGCLFKSIPHQLLMFLVVPFLGDQMFDGSHSVRNVS
jgi:hypothetical protein